MIYQIRKRTEPEDAAYSLYLYFLGLSLRNTSKAVSRFDIKCSTTYMFLSLYMLSARISFFCLSSNPKPN